MFKDAFIHEVSLLTDSKHTIEKLWFEIEEHYAHNNRHYHNLQHLNHLLQQLLAVKHLIKDWPVMVFAIAYHDIIYNPLKHDNEQKSAGLAIKRLPLLHLSVEQIAKCQSLILATKTHEQKKSNDINLFTDADLCILGSPSAQYQTYISCIRKEYNFYPDLLYKPGRAKVLRHFLSMEKIFKTDYFYNLYEAKARANMNNELASLA